MSLHSRCVILGGLVARQSWAVPARPHMDSHCAALPQILSATSAVRPCFGLAAQLSQQLNLLRGVTLNATGAGAWRLANTLLQFRLAEVQGSSVASWHMGLA